jgi:hypothetical protein
MHENGPSLVIFLTGIVLASPSKQLGRGFDHALGSISLPGRPSGSKAAEKSVVSDSPEMAGVGRQTDGCASI